MFSASAFSSEKTRISRAPDAEESNSAIIASNRMSMGGGADTMIELVRRSGVSVTCSRIAATIRG